jgi:hypothetical protein
VIVSAEPIASCVILGCMELTLIGEERGKDRLPDEVKIRYGFEQDIPVRLIVTRRSDVLLLSLTDDPMHESLQSELEEWQGLGMLSISMLPYEHSASPYDDDEEMPI